MYRLYLKQNGKQVLLPVTPAEIEIKTGNCNRVVYILNMGNESGKESWVAGDSIYSAAAWEEISFCADRRWFS